MMRRLPSILVLIAALAAALPVWADGTPEEAAWRIARTLAQERGVTGPEYGRYLENLALYVRHAFPEAQLLEMASRPADIGREFRLRLLGNNRYQKKIIRELDEPYTNSEVETRLRSTAEVVADVVRAIRSANAANSPYELFLGGSLARARFGSNSDVEILMKSPDAALVERVRQIVTAAYPKTASNFHVDFFGWTPPAFMPMEYQPRIALGDGSAFLEAPAPKLAAAYERIRAEHMGVLDGQRVRLPVVEIPEFPSSFWYVMKMAAASTSGSKASLAGQLATLEEFGDPATQSAARGARQWVLRQSDATLRAMERIYTLEGVPAVQPNRSPIGNRVARRAAHEAKEGAKFAAAFLLKEGMNAAVTLDPSRMAAAGQQLATWDFWYALGTFTAGARAAEATLAHARVKSRIPKAARPFAGGSAALAAGMTAAEAADGRFDAGRVAVGVGVYAGVGAGLERTLYPALLRLGPIGRGARVVTLAATLFAGEKVETVLHESAQSPHP